MTQINKLHAPADRLHLRFGSKKLRAVHGAGCIHRPRVMFVFINPTGKNISAHPTWTGMRAQWLGTKHVWKLFHRTGMLSENIFRRTQTLRPKDWTPLFSKSLYANISRNKIYITNLAKCTQDTAKPINPMALRAYLPLLLKEISITKPKSIITFGNQVSSLVLGFPVSVNKYPGIKYEPLSVDEKLYKVFPVHYPVGQGMRNLPIAIKRIKRILSRR